MKGQKTGGRVKGVKNRASTIVEEILEGLGCDPVAGMVAIAENPEHSPELRGKMYSELAQYLHPKRKALEHSGSDGGPLTVIVRSVLQKPPDKP